MALCPFADHKLLPENESQPRIEPRIAIAHSAAGSGSLYRFFLNGSNLESHFWISKTGIIEQYMDTNVRADANLKANAFAVSIETESSIAATEPWTDAQVKALIRLLDWLCDTHPAILRRQCPAWDAAGLGWHIMFGAPGPWTPVAKSCPGPARIKQMQTVIIPAVIKAGANITLAKEDIDMTADELSKMLDAKLAPIKTELAEVKRQVAVSQDANAPKGRTLRHIVASDLNNGD